MELITGWMSHCIKGAGGTPAPCHLALHKMLLQELGAARSQMLHGGNLGGSETLIQLSQVVVFQSPQRPVNSVLVPDFPKAASCQTVVEGA